MSGDSCDEPSALFAGTAPTTTSITPVVFKPEIGKFTLVFLQTFEFFMNFVMSN